MVDYAGYPVSGLRGAGGEVRGEDIARGGRGGALHRWRRPVSTQGVGWVDRGERIWKGLESVRRKLVARGLDSSATGLRL